MAERRTGTLIIGASAAGLTVARCLQRRSAAFVLLEKYNQVGETWRQRYDRLHLHTSKRLSALPDRPFAAQVPKYPSRDQVVAYLELYAREFDLQPHFGQEVLSLRRGPRGWQALTRDDRYLAPNVVIATGYARTPHRPTWEGTAMYEGEVLHSAQYKNGASYAGQDVLVVGCGNSGGEIALDLSEHGARPVISVRGAVHIVPRDLLGIPILAWSIVLSRLPLRLADLLAAPLIWASIGDLSKYGLRGPADGPLTQIAERERIPLIDVGTVEAIKRGSVGVRAGIARFTRDGVEFVDGQTQRFDAVVLATGYRPALSDFLEESNVVTDERGTPQVSGGESSLPGLYFCGFYVSPAGMLHEISVEAPRIADEICASGET